MSPKNTWGKYIQKRLESQKEKAHFRSLPRFDSLQPGYLLAGDNRYLNLCANDYLGLAADPSSHEEGKVLAEVLPSGAGASRLVTGNLAIHEELEKILADWKKTEAALVFPSGYQTNLGVISALAGKGDSVFSDKLNHASIIDGCRLSGAALHRYRHNDMNDLQSLLSSKRGRKKLIITDGVFSMDGDIAPLPEIIDLARHYGAMVFIDDAHASGVLGPNGAGTLSHYGLEWDKDIVVMGTMSKAIGCQGGFVCTTNEIREYLINFCRSFIYSTGISPWMAAMAHFNICRIRSESQLLAQFRSAVSVLRGELNQRGVPVDDLPTPIIPIVLGESRRALQCAGELLQQNIIAAAIRPPTVPDGTARIRISLSAAHQADDLKKAAEFLAEIIESNDSI
ncbi:MAG: 8-amino-7-oxononanoate synthase [Candidatus Omnitrophica bacterium]|nr:8-amino-7-oxononanoate synthase [Candidatus Omnitrophota bacterium]